MMVCANCKGAVPEGATMCPSCGEPRRAPGPPAAAGSKAARFWGAFTLGFIISLVWTFQAAATWTKETTPGRSAITLAVGIVVLLLPLVLLVATYVPAVPEHFRTPLARRFAAGLLVGVLAPFFSGFGAVVGVLGACFGSPI